MFQAVVSKDNIGLQQQQQSQQQILSSQPAREQVVSVTRDGSGRGEAEDQSQSFLKKKEEELRQKRERERQTAEAKTKQTADATFTVSPPAVVKVMTPTLTPVTGVVSKLEFVPVTTATSPTEAVTSSLISAPVRTVVTTTTTSVANKIPKTVTAASAPSVVTSAARPLPGAGANIPQFYFPLGAPTPGMVELDEAAVKKIREEFERDDGKLGKNALGPVVKVCLKLIITVNYCFCNQSRHSQQTNWRHPPGRPQTVTSPTIHVYNINNNTVHWLSHTSMQPPERQVRRQSLLLPERKTCMLILMADISLSRSPLRP